MAKGTDQEKTERATPRKREESRRKGQVAKSKEVSSAVSFLFILIALYFFAPYFLKRILMMMKGFLSEVTVIEVTTTNLNLLTNQALYQVSMLLAPLFIVIMFGGILGNVMQSGFLLTGESLIPDLNKVNPVKGFGKLFSKQSLVDMVKSIAKIVVIAYLAVSVVQKEFLGTLPTLVDMDVGGILFYVCRISYKILIHVFLFMIVLAFFDYVYQRWQYRRDQGTGMKTRGQGSGMKTRDEDQGSGVRDEDQGSGVSRQGSRLLN